MDLFKNNFLIISLSSLLLISGCGDMFQKPVDDKALESNKFKASCELNIDEFSMIMEEPIQETIDCLGQNLKLFVKAVESRKPGYLSRVALENYIKRNRKDIKPEVLRVLKSVFDINYLIYGDDPDFISESNIDAIVKLAKIFNEKASTNFKPIFMSEGSIDYENYRVQRDQRIKPAALVISSALRQVFRPNRDKIHKLDLIGLLDSFTTENNAEAVAKVKKVLFIKKIILGGEKDQITHIELARLIENFSSFALLALDAVRYKDIRLNQESMIHFLNSDVELLNSLIFSPTLGNRDQENLFSLKDAINAFNIFSDKSNLNLLEYYDLLKEAKQVVMDGTPEVITGGDLQRLFNHGLNILKTGTFFYRFWSTERVLLESRPGRPVTYDFRNLYDLFRNEKTRVNDFVRILKNYRFMRGENISAFYTDDYWRNPSAVYEIAIFEYATTLVMRKYGCPNNTLAGKVVCDAKPALNGVYMVKDQIINLVKKLSKVLVENDLIYPGREEKSAETITLLGSLFQYQSNENKVFDVNEVTEFAISLFTSIDVSNDVADHFNGLVKDGKCEVDEFGRYSPDCFRKYFFEGVCLNYPDQFPKLFESLGATVYETDARKPGVKKLVCKIPQLTTNISFLNTTVKAARTCNVYPNNQEEIFYSKSDLMSIFLAMMHIETTIIRWDVRTRNNIMDSAEVMDAYNIYSSALDGFLSDKPAIIQKLKKQIYLFMVKYEQVPNEKQFGSLLKFAKFLLSFNKDAPANRKTIASLLLAVSEQGAPSTFDCNLLRNPESIPAMEVGDTIAAESEISTSNSPLVLTRDDMFVAQEIEGEQEGWVRSFFSKNWPDLLNYHL